MIRIHIRDSETSPQTLEFNKTSILIGRSEQADVVLPSESVSRRHCRIEERHGEWTVNDVGSPNGVFLRRKNGEQVERVVSDKIFDGDRIQIDRFTLTFEKVAADPFSMVDDDDRVAALFSGNDANRTMIIPLYRARHQLEDNPIRLNTGEISAAKAPVESSKTEAIAQKQTENAEANGAATVSTAQQTDSGDSSVEQNIWALMPGASIEGGQYEREQLRRRTSPGGLHVTPRGGFLLHIRDSSNGRDDTLQFEGEASLGFGMCCDVAIDASKRDRQLGVLRRLHDRVCFERSAWWPLPRTLVNNVSVKHPIFQDGEVMSIGSVSIELRLA